MKEGLKSFTIRLSVDDIGAISNSTGQTVDDVLKDLLLTSRNDKVRYICNVILGRQEQTQEIDSEMRDIIDSICFYTRLYKPEVYSIKQVSDVVKELLA